MPIVEAIERTFGGLSIGDVTFTARAPGAPLPVEVVQDGAPLALCALRWLRDPIYVDARGRLFERPSWRPHDPLTLAAESAHVLIERLALRAWLLSLPVCVEVDRRLAAPLAAALALPPVPDASAADASWWCDREDGRLAVLDGRVDRPADEVTLLFGHASSLPPALRGLAALGLDVRVCALVHHPLDTSGKLRAFTLLAPERAPARPRASPALLRLGSAADASLEGVLDPSGTTLRALETRAERVLVEITWSDAHADPVERRFLEATAHVAPRVTREALGGIAAARLALDPRKRLSPADVEPMLRAAGVEHTGPLLALEDALGGLQLGDDTHGMTLGLAHALSARGAALARRSDGRFPFGGWSDASLLADADGRVHFVDDIDGTDHVLADDGPHLLERQLDAHAPSFVGFTITIEARVGAAIAALVDADPDGVLGDTTWRVWRRDDARIEEGPAREGTVLTRCTLGSIAQLRACAAGLVALAAPLSCFHADVADVLEAAGATLARVRNAPRFEPSPPEDAELRARAVRDGTTPAADLASLASSASAALRRAVVERADAPLAALAAALDATGVSSLDEVIVIDAIARHPAASDVLLERIVALVPSVPVGGALVRAAMFHPQVPRALRERALRDRRPEVRHALAITASPTDLIEALARDVDATVRCAAAAHPAQTAAALAILARDPDRAVREAVACADATSDDTLVALVGDARADVPFALTRRRAPLPLEVGLRAAFHPWALRDLVIAAMPLPERALRDLAQSPLTSCRVGVASHRDAPVDVLLRLVEDGERRVRLLALGHPALASRALEGAEAARAGHPLVAATVAPIVTPAPDASLGRVLSREASFRGAWAAHPTLPAAMLRALADDPDDLVAYAAARHPWAPPEALAALAAHRYAYARAAAVSHALAPDDVRTRALRDPSAMVRAAAAACAPLTPDAWTRLATDQAHEVREALATRADCPTPLLETLARDPHEYVRRGVVTSPAAPPALLAAMARDAHTQVRSRLPLSPACPVDAIAPLLDDPDPQVRHAAIWRLLAERPYESVRRGA